MFYRRNNEDVSTTEPQGQQRDSTIDFDVLGDFDAPVEASSTEAIWQDEAPPANGYRNAAPVEQPRATQVIELPEPTPFVPNPPSTSDTAPRARPSESVIGPDDFFDGNYRSERGVRIQGNARGSIESRQYIYVEEGAHVEANLAAEDITVSGHFNGTIECRRRLEVTGSGVVQGNVQTARLVVHEGGVLDGELHMQREERAAGNEQEQAA